MISEPPAPHILRRLGVRIAPGQHNIKLIFSVRNGSVWKAFREVITFQNEEQWKIQIMGGRRFRNHQIVGYLYDQFAYYRFSKWDKGENRYKIMKEIEPYPKDDGDVWLNLFNSMSLGGGESVLPHHFNRF